MRVLDTDLITILMNGPTLEQSRLTERLEQGDANIVVTIISFEEQVRGWMALVAKAKVPRVRNNDGRARRPPGYGARKW